jgi:hypothetical protein
MEKCKKPSNPVCYTPPSEPFRIYSSILFIVDLLTYHPTLYSLDAEKASLNNQQEKENWMH